MPLRSEWQAISAPHSTATHATVGLRAMSGTGFSLACVTWITSSAVIVTTDGGGYGSPIGYGSRARSAAAPAADNFKAGFITQLSKENEAINKSENNTVFVSRLLRFFMMRCLPGCL